MLYPVEPLFSLGTCTRCGGLQRILVVDEDTRKTVAKVRCPLCGSRTPGIEADVTPPKEDSEPFGGYYRLWPKGDDSEGVPSRMILLRQSLRCRGVPLEHLQMRYRRTPFGTDIHILMLSTTVSEVVVREASTPYHQTDLLAVAHSSNRVDIDWSPCILRRAAASLAHLNEESIDDFQLGDFLIQRSAESSKSFQWSFHPSGPSMTLDQLRGCQSVLVRNAQILGVPNQIQTLAELKIALFRLLSLTQQLGLIGFQPA